MAENKNSLDLSKIGDTVIRDADSDSKPEFQPEDTKKSKQENRLQVNRRPTVNFNHLNDQSLDVSKIGDTVIRDQNQDHHLEPVLKPEEDPSDSKTETEHPFKYQEPSFKKSIHSHTSHWQQKDGSFDVSKIGDTVIRGRDHDPHPEDSKKEPSSD